MSVKRDLLLMTPRDLRARFSKIHKHYRLAMEIADVRVSQGENAQRRDGLPVHKLFSNVLMSRVEFRSRKYFSGATWRQNILNHEAYEKCLPHMHFMVLSHVCLLSR